MLKRKLCIFLSLGISIMFCLQVIANSEEYQEEQWRKQGIDFHRIESEESAEIVDRYFIEDEDEDVVSHEVMVAKDGTQYHNTSTLVSSHVEYTDENGNVIKVDDYVNPDYADPNKKSDDITLHDAYGVYNAYKNARSINDVDNTKTTDFPNIMIPITDYEPIENISDIEKSSVCIVKAKALEGKENVIPEGSSMGYTKINLEITDVYKGDLKVGDVIPFMERYFVNGGTEYRRDGYTASEVGKEYLFYLGKCDNGLYDPVCTVFGRYSLEDTQALNDDVDPIESSVAEEYAPLYKQLKSEVMDIYKDK